MKAKPADGNPYRDGPQVVNRNGNHRVVRGSDGGLTLERRSEHTDAMGAVTELWFVCWPMGEDGGVQKAWEALLHMAGRTVAD